MSQAKELAEIASWIASRRYVEAIDCIAQSSYVHPNGFTKIVIPSLYGECEEYRLHIWQGDSEDSDIHNHTSSFVSLVLTGAIEEITFSEVDGNGYDLFEISKRDADGTSILTYRKQTNLRVSGKKTIVPGQSYNIDMDSFHRVRTAGGVPTATLVKQNLRQRDYSVVARPSGIGLGQEAVQTTRALESETALHMLDQYRQFVLKIFGDDAASKHESSRKE